MKRKLMTLLIPLAFVFGVACQPEEKTLGEEVQDVVDEAGDELEDAVDEVEDEIDDAVDG